ncbi:MAG: FHA domain-containing protein [Verrucomicrobia bacterium]|nr:FHA domain-containing protein [Verrucomicrobiota bacterium]
MDLPRRGHEHSHGYLVGQLGEFSGQRIAIPESGLVIGRDPSQVDVVFKHPMVSRQHARIAPTEDGRVCISDLKSRNGTPLNGKKITAPTLLAPGDKVDFGARGQVIFIFESAGQVTWKHGFQAAKILEEYQRFFDPKLAIKMPKRLAKLLSRCFKLDPDDRPKHIPDSRHRCG